MDPLFLAWQMTALVSCLLAATAMLVFFFKFPSTRVHPGPVLLSVFLSVCIANLSRVALLTWHPYGGPNDVPVTFTAAANTELTAKIPGLESYVGFFFWCDFFFETAATMWYLMLALDLIFSLSNPFLPFHADNVKHHVFAWPIAMLWCLVFRYAFQNDDSRASNNIVLYMHLPALGVLLYVMVTLLLAWRRSRRLEAQAHHTTRLMAKRILPYLAVFAADTALVFGLYVVQVSLGKDTTTSSAVDQLALVLEALCLFVLFSRDTGVFAALRRSTPPPRSDSPGHVPLNAAGDSTPPPTGNAEGRDNTETLDVGLELRMCVMKYMSMGIFEGIKQAERAANQDIDSSSSEIVFDDYNRVEAMSIVVHGELASGVLNFRDCAPKVFHQIRAQFKIDSQLYRDSFDVSKYVDLRRQMKEKGSEGKSGNIFYFTANDQFMVKSVPKEEFDTLRAILPHYHRYLLSNPQSMLCRYFGCHSISLPVGKRRMYFVVMQNLFNDGAVHQRFDLKGNRDRRQAIGTSQVENYIQLAKEQQTIKKLMMDIDFRKFNGGIAATLNMATKLQGQLCDDVVFLASRGIIDYSILLGVRYVNNGSERFPSLAPHSSGFYANDGEKIYYVGLVDMLQRYNWRWTVQRWFLGLICKDTHDVSAVPPKEYGDRLTDFVRSRLFDIQHSSNPRLSRMALTAGIGSGGSNQAVLSVHGNDTEGGYAGYHHRCRTGSEGTYHTTIDMDNDVRPSACLRELALSSPSSDSHHSLYRNSTSSSPSVAYSSVGESPASVGKPTFFV